MSFILMSTIWILVLLLITATQCWQIYTMKRELRKCLRIISRLRRISGYGKAISQISKSLDCFEKF